MIIAFIETQKVNQTWMKTLSRKEEHFLELCKVPKVISDHVQVIFMHVSNSNTTTLAFDWDKPWTDNVLMFVDNLVIFWGIYG